MGCRSIALVLASTLAVGCRAQSADRPSTPTRLALPPDRPSLMFVSVASDDTFKHVLLGPLAAPGTSAFVTPLVVIVPEPVTLELFATVASSRLVISCTSVVSQGENDSLEVPFDEIVQENP